MNELAAKLESGELKTAADVVRALEAQVGSLEGKISVTKTTVYLEDTPTRYLRIRKGNPHVCLVAGEDAGPRKSTVKLRRVEGDLPTIFREMQISDRPRIVVKTQNQKGYEVVYSHEDVQAVATVAEQLGLKVHEEVPADGGASRTSASVLVIEDR